MSKIVKLDDYKYDAELRKHLAIIDEQIRETQKSIKDYICNRLQDEDLMILRTEIQDHHIKVEFIYTGEPDNET